jgi:hypothetical protein
MKKIYFHGCSFLVPFLRNEELKTFENVSEDDISRLNETVEKFTAAKTYAERQKILSEYEASIDIKDNGSAFYKAMLGMMLNLRRDAYSSGGVILPDNR